MEENSNEKTGGKNWVAIVVVTAILVVAAAAYWYLEKGKGETDPETPGSDTAAIIIDGYEIDRATVDRSIEQITGTYTAQGVDTSGAEAAAAIKEQAVTALVNRQLMINAATEAGVAATDEEVEAQFQVALENVGGQENLASALAGIGMTEEELRADIKNDVLINNYLEDKLGLAELSVSDEEVQAAYDAAAASNAEEVPPLADVAELIKNQLLLEKQQQAISVELEKLRAEAEIEVLV